MIVFFCYVLSFLLKKTEGGYRCIVFELLLEEEERNNSSNIFEIILAFVLWQLQKRKPTQEFRLDANLSKLDLCLFEIGRRKKDRS